MKIQTKKILAITFSVILLLGIVFSIVYFGFVKQEIVGVSTVPVTQEDGSADYWLISGVAGSIDDGFTFSKIPDKFIDPLTKTETTPKSSLTLSFNKDQSKCIYQLSRESIEVPFLYFLKKTYYYYTPVSKQKFVSVKITDGYAITQYITSQRDEVSFYHGGGSARIKSLGLIPTGYECPEYSDVAILIDQNNNVAYKVKSDLVSKLNNQKGTISLSDAITGLITYFTKSGVKVADSPFPNQFKQGLSLSISPDRSIVEGNYNVGNVFFTITADKEYFNSFVYTPPRQPSPQISDVECKDITQDRNGELIVNIINKNSNDGIVKVDVSYSGGSVFPSSTELNLVGSATARFNVKASNSVLNNQKFNIKVCSESQFGEVNCDTDSCYNDIIKETKDEIEIPILPEEKECTSDLDCLDSKICKDNKCIKELDCAWYQSESVHKEYGFAFWRFFLNAEKETPICATAWWVYLIVTILIFTGIGVFLIIILKIVYGKRRR